MEGVLLSWKRKLKSILIDRLFSHSGDTYQRTRYPEEKFQLIANNLDLEKVHSVLDIGCNEGYIAAEFAKRGKFCVAIDAGPYYLNHILNNLDSVYGKQNPAFGVFPLTEDNIETLPNFDLVLLLSVHHQWTKKYGNDYAERTVRKLIDKSQKYFVIEFSAATSKYGFDVARFSDNNEESVKAYAESWLNGLEIEGSVQYVGRNKEGSVSTEPYRYVYMIKKQGKSSLVKN